jgi:hypothetical protein
VEAAETKMLTSLGGVTLLEHKLTEGIRKTFIAVPNASSEAHACTIFNGSVGPFLSDS